MMRSRVYRSGVVTSEQLSVDQVAEIVQDSNVTVWLDFTSPQADDLERVQEILGIHELAIEDAVTGYQRPKLDRYTSHLFLAAYTVDFHGETGELVTAEVRAIIAGQVLVTVHEPHFDMDAIVERWDNEVDLAGHGVAFLVWGLLDVVVDGYFDTVQELDAEIDALEDRLFDTKPDTLEAQRRSFELRKSLGRLRRIVLPMREVLNTLMRRDVSARFPEMMPYLQDVYDHVLRVTEWTDSLRDMIATILETNISLQGNRMNLIMKKVTSWAAIIAVPTAITGFYGQNLPYPGFSEAWGFWASSGLIVVISLGLYFTFKKRDWL